MTEKAKMEQVAVGKERVILCMKWGTKYGPELSLIHI